MDVLPLDVQVHAYMGGRDMTLKGLLYRPLLPDGERRMPLSCPERAAEIYSDAELHVIREGGHRFHGEALRQSINLVTAYFLRIFKLKPI